MNAPNWTPAFAGETNIRKAWFFVVIPAEAGIQALKAKVPFLDSRFRGNDILATLLNAREPGQFVVKF